MFGEQSSDVAGATAKVNHVPGAAAAKTGDQIERRSPPGFDELEVLLGVPAHSL